MSQSQEASDTFDLKLILETLQGEISRINRRFDTLEDKMEKASASKSTSKKQPQLEELFGSNYEEDFGKTGHQSKDTRQNPNQGNDDTIKGIKLNIPSFQGKSNPEAYLEWERKIEKIFDCHNYSELQKVKLAVVDFTDYAAIWWDQLRIRQRRNEAPSIQTWDDLKLIMRKRFISAYYHRELHNKLQTLSQGSMTAEDYYKEMEMAMMRADIREDSEATMARFLRGLRAEIADIVELHHYLDIEELVDKANKVEKRLKRRGTPRPTSNFQPGNWRNQPSKEENSTSIAQNQVKGGGTTNGSNRPTFPSSKPRPREEFKGNQEATKARTRDTKCFKCQGFGHIAS